MYKSFESRCLGGNCLKPRIMLLEACNYINAPLGGQLTAARMLMQALGPCLALAGWTDDPSAPIGIWHKRVIDGIEFDFFATSYVPSPQQNRPLIPIRATSYFQFLRYGHAILSVGIANILVQEPTIIMALPFSSYHNVCFWAPGIEPALSVSRYKWARYISPLFDRLLNRKLCHYASAILAAADDDAINEWKIRASGLLDSCNIYSFPTRVDTKLFFPDNKINARLKISLPIDSIICITTGRLHQFKGWSLMIDSFREFNKRYNNSILIFVGDGSDRSAIERKIAEIGLGEKIIIAGQQPPKIVASYLRSADLFIMGSMKEGWSTSLLEALATGLPIVTTKFSSANGIVRNGLNGFVVNRDPVVFANAMEDALRLKEVKDYSMKEIEKYSLANLSTDLYNAWLCCRHFN